MKKFFIISLVIFNLLVIGSPVYAIYTRPKMVIHWAHEVLGGFYEYYEATHGALPPIEARATLQEFCDYLSGLSDDDDESEDE